MARKSKDKPNNRGSRSKVLEVRLTVMPIPTLVKASTDPRPVRDNDVAVASSNDEQLRLASLCMTASTVSLLSHPDSFNISTILTNNHSYLSKSPRAKAGTEFPSIIPNYNKQHTMSSNEQNPSLVGGHAQYVKGPAEVSLTTTNNNNNTFPSKHSPPTLLKTSLLTNPRTRAQ